MVNPQICSCILILLLETLGLLQKNAGQITENTAFLFLALFLAHPDSKFWA